ncbi:hypothetical protein [Jatrophihabitans sp.]|uniref:hypothetical protein n=1 Tax=Jatrophihabitans sp. TaxID=1932789 RepID=UPI003F821745
MTILIFGAGWANVADMEDDEYVGDSVGRKLLEAGSEIVGATSGAAIGMLVAGPAGALAGAAGGPVVQRAFRETVDEVGARLLSRRERARSGAAAIYAADHLQKVLAAGATIRTDGFFDDAPDGRNAGREIAEGVLLRARDAFEERKIQHIGCMFARVATDSAVDAGLAAWVLRQAETLTWRQYVMLAAVGRAELIPLPTSVIGAPARSWWKWGAHREFRDLYEYGFLDSPPKQTANRGFPIPNTEMSEQRLGNSGMALLMLLALDEISDAEVLKIHDALRPPTDPLDETVG